MKISNLRIDVENEKSYVVVDVECDFSSSKTLWFNVDNQYKEWLTDCTYDAFLVAAVYMGMYYSEDIEIRGTVTKSIYRNIIDYLMPTIHAFRPELQMIDIKVNGFSKVEPNNLGIIGTGFSGGVDSFGTIIDRFENESDPEYKINTLFFFNVGQYKGATQQDRLRHALQYYENSLPLANTLGVPFIFMDSNLFEFYLPEWEYDAGPLIRCASVLVFQKALTKYFVSGSNHYLQQNTWPERNLDDLTDAFIYYMLSTTKTEIILDGNQHFRHEKVVALSKYEYARNNLNVCVNPIIDVRKDKNCSHCHKCLRTLIILEALGCLEEFKKVFDISRYKKESKRYKSSIVLLNGKDPYATENYLFAKSQGVKFPNKIAAYWIVYGHKVLNKLKRFF